MHVNRKNVLLIHLTVHWPYAGMELPSSSKFLLYLTCPDWRSLTALRRIITLCRSLRSQIVLS